MIKYFKKMNKNMKSFIDTQKEENIVLRTPYNYKKYGLSKLIMEGKLFYEI